MFPMKTGFSTETSLSLSDKSVLMSLSESMIKEVINVSQVIISHNDHIKVINQQLMLKCIKYVVLDPNAIGAKMGELLNFVFLMNEEEDKIPEGLDGLTTDIQSNFSKHYTRLEQKTSELASLGEPASFNSIAKPILSDLLSEYFEPASDQEMSDQDVSDEEQIEDPENARLSCLCQTCTRIMEVGNIQEFDASTQTNPFIKAIYNSLTNVENKYGTK
jgi:hypothetical protein